MHGEIGFDSSKYVEEQTRYILERVQASSGRLYIECGGKLLHDKHASRVLPGFDENNKMKVFQSLKDKLDIIICIYAGDIERRKIRSDFGISYDADVLRMIDDFAAYGIKCDKVVITRYENQVAASVFKDKLERRGINVYTHPRTPGYPANIDVVVSENGYGKNEYIPVNAPVVIVTAPGPGSGRAAEPVDGGVAVLCRGWDRPAVPLLRHRRLRPVDGRLCPLACPGGRPGRQPVPGPLWGGHSLFPIRGPGDALAPMAGGRPTAGQAAPAGGCPSIDPTLFLF